MPRRARKFGEEVFVRVRLREVERDALKVIRGQKLVNRAADSAKRTINKVNAAARRIAGLRRLFDVAAKTAIDSLAAAGRDV